ncbi:MAG: LytTR family DNA-binding domain-containing protein [Chitinophagales bacterium]
MIIASVLIYISTYIFKNYTFTYFIQHDRILTYRESLLYSFIIGVFIYVFIKLSDDFFYRIENQYFNRTENNNQMYGSNGFSSIEIEGKNKDEEITLNPNSIIHIEAQGNYAKIVYQIESEEKVTKSEVFRTSITELLEQLSEFNFLYCCHRSHIINLNYITNITGNSKSMNVEIKMPSYVASVSVSRLKISEFLDLWEKHQKK